MPDLEAVISCKHGQMDSHLRGFGEDTHKCPGPRYVRLVEVQPDITATRSVRVRTPNGEYITAGDLLDDNELGAVVDAAVDGPYYRLENIE